MKDLLTIVIPCKNEEKYIGNLLDDLESQGVHWVRIIVADGGSTDRTIQIVEQYKGYLNIEVIQGGTVSVGRNNGAALVTTPYVLFLDADVRFFDGIAIYDTLMDMKHHDLYLMTLKIKNYGTDIRATFLFWAFNIINRIMARYTPFAIGAFFLTRVDVFNQLGRFPNKYETSEDYILSKQYSPKKFKIGYHFFGQDERRFRKMGYVGMLMYMARNFINRHNLKYFENANVNYWD